MKALDSLCRKNNADENTNTQSHTILPTMSEFRDVYTHGSTIRNLNLENKPEGLFIKRLTDRKLRGIFKRFYEEQSSKSPISVPHHFIWAIPFYSSLRWKWSAPEGSPQRWLSPLHSAVVSLIHRTASLELRKRTVGSHWTVVSSDVIPSCLSLQTC